MAAVMRWTRKPVLTGIAVGLLGALALLTPYGNAVEEELGLDWLFRLRGPTERPAHVLVLGIDRASLDWMRALPDRWDAWPEPLRRCLPDGFPPERLHSARRASDWPRQIHACVLDMLVARGASAVVFDMALMESRTEDEDAALAAAIARSGRTVLLQAIERITVPPLGAAAEPSLFDVLISPTGMLADAAAALAPFPLPQDSARLNRVWLFKESIGGAPTLPVAALAVHEREALAPLASAEGGAGGRRDAPARVPTDPEILRPWLERQLPRPDAPEDAAIALARLRDAYLGSSERYLNLYGPPGTVATLSYYRLLRNGAALLPDLAGTAVFIGLSDLASADQPDRQYTVFRRADAVDLSGVEIAATAFANLLLDQSLRPLSSAAAAPVLLLFGLAAAQIGFRRRATAAVAGGLALAAAYTACAALAFAFGRIWPPLAIPLLLQLPLALGAGLILQRAAAVRWLGTYLPRAVADHLLAGSARDPAPVERTITVMFTDIAGFTALAERLSADAVARLLNAHFALLTRCIERESGVVDKYLGDGLLAFWGAPEPAADHARRACRAALAIAAAIGADNVRRRAAGEPPIRMRIGIHTGPATLGNIGGSGRHDYTVVGDTVNIGQRIEQLCRTVYPEDREVCILVSEATAAGLGQAFRTRPAGLHRLRGHDAPTGIFMLV